MKLRQFQCLCALVDARFNISHAAAALHATQPAVGKQLRQFEDEVGAELLRRRGARIIGLSDAGEQALAWARQALQCAANIRALGEGGGGDTPGGSIALATTHTHARYVLLPALKAYSQRFPQVQFNVLQGTPEGVAELLLNGQADLGLTSVPAQLSPDLVAVPVLTATHVVVAPTGHPVLRMKGLTLEKLARFPIILQHPSRFQGARIARKFHDAGIEVHFAVQALDTDVMKAYVAEGLGIAIIPAFTYTRRHDPGLRTRDASHLFDPTTSVVLLRRHAFLRPALAEFLSVLAPALTRRRLETVVNEAAR